MKDIAYTLLYPLIGAIVLKFTGPSIMGYASMIPILYFAHSSHVFYVRRQRFLSCVEGRNVTHVRNHYALGLLSVAFLVLYESMQALHYTIADYPRNVVLGSYVVLYAPHCLLKHLSLRSIKKVELIKRETEESVEQVSAGYVANRAEPEK